LELDRKGNLKNIKAMASRRTFLEDPTGITPLARTLFPYAAVLSFILPSSKSTGLL
jgi:hypothetical protein